MKTAFGLDLAGYSTAGSALVMATADDDRPTVTILNDCPFAQPAAGENLLEDITRREIRCLCDLFQRGPVFIDVPIDLQDLPAPRNARFVWQLTKRPVDQAFEGLCPLADRIGAYVARMQNLLRRLRHENHDAFEHKLFETYPAGSLRIAEQVHEGYKGDAEYRNSHWRPRPSKDEKQQKRNDTLARMLNSRRWIGENDGFILRHDEFDAALCALTGFGQRLCGEDLRKEINRRLAESGYGNGHSAPQGYVLLKEIPQDVGCCRKGWTELE